MAQVSDGVGDLAVGSRPLRDRSGVGGVGHAGKEVVDADHLDVAVLPAGSPEDGLHRRRRQDVSTVVAEDAWQVEAVAGPGDPLLSPGLPGERHAQRAGGGPLGGRQGVWLRDY